MKVYTFRFQVDGSMSKAEMQEALDKVFVNENEPNLIEPLQQLNDSIVSIR